MSRASRVLIADDDRAIRDSLERALQLEGYEVRTVADGVQALAAVHGDPVDLLVLDVMMPGVDGLGVCRVLRAEGDRTPILMLTARVETPDRVAGLDAGADDYLPKPFELDELLARLRALLRRAAPAEDGEGAQLLRVGDLRMDPGARRVWRGGTEVVLSKTEFDLLELLVRNAGIVLDHATIYDRIWGYDFGPESKNLAVYISYLRRKLEPQGTPPLIQTVRGVGYTVRPQTSR
ncbi:response regulator transcription factor [Streptomonospora nanhaiensis]|uniref:Two-component system response regulator MprA n=1 Tax=Streptomonospora nanhaiensis TaxID=1323731 RepID=A0A853BSB2_9ACTN|nr:response regulator transcription factor [Streptomonospora nanhaiensis]MBV2363824.1 response regulator transcription factor [Streptomonospora nanhaiensis]MBX9388783.1 response regulator transcription factor [Streptomonospora nanhaiensis]NYI97615.1 two-component system response regulator MprA [Streptomonospora nanhaiensis]